MNDNQQYIWPNLAGGPVITDKQGIDYLIVMPGQTTLKIHFLKYVTMALEDKEVYLIEGGERITSIKVTGAVKEGNKVIRLQLDRFGDWSPYRLIIKESVWEGANIDPVFARVRFSFKVRCPKDMDCRPHLPGFETFPALRNFDYQAKDFESFKQAMLDRLPSTIPDWWDRAEADFGIAIIDLLAFAGDRLSYYQDRVASEVVLQTARARQSVSGHLKLLDYALDPGETARTLLHLKVDRDMTVPEGLKVETPALSYETPVTFTLTEPFYAYRDLNQLRLYDFFHPTLFIPEGALQMTVAGHPEGLKEGSLLIIIQGDDEASGEITGCKRHLIKLSRDPLYRQSTEGGDITVLTWDDTYALPWDLPVSGGYILGNITELVHGRHYRSLSYVDGILAHFDLPAGPLGYQDGLPMISLKVDGEVWERVKSLKESEPYERHYQIVDLDNKKNRILFGNNENGLRPAKYSMIEIEYHAGLGASGNVAACTITKLPENVKGINSVINPFAGQYGRDPETEEHGRRWGPKRIREQKRAVTPDDYAREAMHVPGISRAIARFVWTGSWVTVRITLDPQGTEHLGDELRDAVYDHLLSRKMAGYDIRIFPVRFVPLEIKIRFCLEDLAFRDQVFRDLNSALGNSVGADGVRGFFHPDSRTFGQGVQLSELYAAIARVQGIKCAEVLVFKRLRKPQGNELERGEIPMQWDEIARLDNDRNFPEHGKLELQLVGGR